MWFTEGAAGGNGACVEANESTPGVWETCNADDAPLTHGCNRTVQTYRTRCPLDAANRSAPTTARARLQPPPAAAARRLRVVRGRRALRAAARGAGGGRRVALCNSVDQKKCALSVQGPS